MKILLLALFLNCSIFAFNSSKILFMKGDVKVEREGQTLNANKGMSLNDNDIIKTGIDSFAIVKIENHSKLKVDDNSSLTIQLADITSTAKDITYINMIKGSLLMDFSKDKNNNEVFINVNNIAMGVRGTRFLVGANSGEEENITLAVERGQVDIFNYEKDDSESVVAGHGVVVENGEELTKPYQYDWMSNVNWDVQDEKAGSNFRGRRIRQKRLAEFKSKRKELRERIKNRIGKLDKEKREKIIQRIKSRRDNRRNKRTERRKNRQKRMEKRKQRRERRGRQVKKRFEQKKQPPPPKSLKDKLKKIKK